MHFDLDHHRISREDVGREVGDSHSPLLPFSINFLGTSFSYVLSFSLAYCSRNIPWWLPFHSAIVILPSTGRSTPRRRIVGRIDNMMEWWYRLSAASVKTFSQKK